MTYALYKGDKFLIVGNKKECAKYLGVSVKTISFYLSPTYKKRSGDSENRIIAIKVEED